MVELFSSPCFQTLGCAAAGNKIEQLFVKIIEGYDKYVPVLNSKTKEIKGSPEQNSSSR